MSLRDTDVELQLVKIEVPEGMNIIVGQSHFIKTAEDLYEVIVSTVPDSKFGIAFCEASGPCLIRVEGNDDNLKKLSGDWAGQIGAGHTFVIVLRDAYPVNILDRVKNCPEVCTVFCATANPVEFVVAGSERGRGILGVIDGSSPKGVEGHDDVRKRREFLRKIGYKL